MSADEAAVERVALREIADLAEDIGGKLPAQRCLLIAQRARAALAAAPAPGKFAGLSDRELRMIRARFAGVNDADWGDFQREVTAELSRRAQGAGS